jgi:4-hydroxyacetophenone monooxygenase
MTRSRHTGDAVTLEDAIALANVPTLLLVLIQLTGDQRWMAPKYSPTRSRGLDDNDTGGLPAFVQAEIRIAALAAIRKWQGDRIVSVPRPPQEMIIRMMSFAMGEDIPPEYGPMMAAELAAGNATSTATAIPPSGFRAIIIGAGVSGLCAAHYLGERGIPCSIIDKNDAIGGTWHENRYPAAGVDTPSHLYSYSFAKNDWRQYFSAATDVQRYLEEIASKLNVCCDIRLKTEAVRATYDDTRQEWNVTIRDENGEQSELSATILISAVGALNRPVVPALKGLENFQGPAFHTARWPHELDITGKRIAVVGTGASAMQVVPRIADVAASIAIFQRSPQWAAPFDKLHKEVPAPIRYLLKEVPPYEAWYRLRLGWTFNDKLYPSLVKDPQWNSKDSINAINAGYRRYFERYIRDELADREDLIPKVVPSYPPFLKRLLLDNGWFRALTRENVELVANDNVEQITADGILTKSGKHYPCDVIVFATGFDATRFLASIEVIGRKGKSLRQAWDDDDARAYLGIAVPEFPNFFCMYGPNLQPGHGGSLMFVFECQMHYLMDLLEQMFERGIGAIECRKDVHDEYNRRIDEAHATRIWTHAGASTYYRNGRGRVVVNSPHRVVDYWRLTRSADLSDYNIEFPQEIT